MNFLFENSTNTNIDNETLETIKKVIEETLIYENFTTNVEISFLIVTAEEIKEINNKFRNINKETDVLSFPLIDDFNIDFSNLKTYLPLGDIIINIEKAILQAKEYGHTFIREISFLTVHSMLHLLGYDHMTKLEEEVMFKRQDEILNKLNIVR